MAYERFTVWHVDTDDGLQDLTVLYDPVSLAARFAIYVNTWRTVMVVEAVNARRQRLTIKLPPTKVPVPFRLTPGRFRFERRLGQVVFPREVTMKVTQEPMSYQEPIME